MIEKPFAISVLLSLALAPAAVSAQGVNDGHGKEWRQLIETTGLSWNQVAEVAPQDGATPAAGVVGGRDLTGWIWATEDQVINLFSYFEDDILSSPSISGQSYFFTASDFLSAFRPTFSFTITYQSGQFAAGWTASTDLNSQPIAGSVSAGTTPVSIGGSFAVGPVPNPDEVRSDRGVFLWRPTGFETGAVFANDDAGQVPSPAGGIAVANVLANDWIGGVRPTIETVGLLQFSSTDAHVLLQSDGSVFVSAGATAGIHTLVYQICDLANPDNCDDAIVQVTVKPYVINAVNDQGSASPSTGGTAVVNVLANDTLGAARATTGNVRISLLSSSNPGVTLDPSDGSVDVAVGAATGTHTLVYEICEIANPSNCDSATVTVTVARPVINAVNDQAKASSKTPNIAIASVLANDWLGNVRATTSNVRLSLVSLSPPSTGIKLDLSDGSVDIIQKVDSGKYTLVYEICELADPSNRDQATVTLDLSGGK